MVNPPPILKHCSRTFREIAAIESNFWSPVRRLTEFCMSNRLDLFWSKPFTSHNLSRQPPFLMLLQLHLQVIACSLFLLAVI